MRVLALAAAVASVMAAIDPAHAQPHGMEDGEPLSFLQDPPVLFPDHSGRFALRSFTVLGDVETVTFERADTSAEDGSTRETWPRVSTGMIGATVVSLFEPSWNEDIFAERLAHSRIGYDQPYIFFGRVVTASAGAEQRTIYLRVGLTGLPHAHVTGISRDAQRASHIVNLVVPGFGDRRVVGGPYGFDVREAARMFYRYFPDRFDGLAFVPRRSHLAGFGAFQRTVKNDIAGIGKPLQDASALYGSAGILQSVEVYTQTELTSNRASSHEIAHRWGDDFDWATLAGISDGGWHPSSHTPLLYQGETLVGSVLDGSRRVTARGSSYAIERTSGAMRFHPLQLYRMGKLIAHLVPPVAVFSDQAQFERRTPDPDTPVSGKTTLVTIDDVIARHGPRRGPSPSLWRRATVIVSRDELLSQAEMDYWNFFARRMGDPSRTGVTDFDGYPSFDALTGYAVDLRTEITTDDSIATDESTAEDDIGYPAFGRRDARGVELDAPLPSRYRVGRSVRVTGRVTATDPHGIDRILLRLWRPGDHHADALRFWGGVQPDGTFAVEVHPEPEHEGIYRLELFLFWPGAGAQDPRSTLSPVTIG